MDTTQAHTVAEQIGLGTILAISGGRKRLEDGRLILPVSNGYTVEVEYDDGADTYTVHRVFSRAGKRWIKGTLADVHAWDISEVAYGAHAFRSYEFPNPEWATA